MANPERYEWADHGGEDALCISVFTGAGLRDVLAGFGVAEQTQTPFPQENELPFGVAHARSSALMLLERVTGFVPAEAAPRRAPRPTYDVLRAPLLAIG
jgi:hypothetical protein